MLFGVYAGIFLNESRAHPWMILNIHPGPKNKKMVTNFLSITIEIHICPEPAKVVITDGHHRDDSFVAWCFGMRVCFSISACSDTFVRG